MDFSNVIMFIYLMFLIAGISFLVTTISYNTKNANEIGKLRMLPNAVLKKQFV